MTSYISGGLISVLESLTRIIASSRLGHVAKLGGKLFFISFVKNGYRNESTCYISGIDILKT